MTLDLKCYVPEVRILPVLRLRAFTTAVVCVRLLGDLLKLQWNISTVTLTGLADKYLAFIGKCFHL